MSILTVGAIFCYHYFCREDKFVVFFVVINNFIVISFCIVKLKQFFARVFF